MQPYAKKSRSTSSEPAVSALAPQQGTSEDFSLSDTPFHFFSLMVTLPVPLLRERVCDCRAVRTEIHPCSPRPRVPGVVRECDATLINLIKRESQACLAEGEGVGRRFYR